MNEHIRTASKTDTLTLGDLVQEFVQSPEQVQTFLQTGWINRVMLQLIAARIEAGLTQSELGYRMGKHQSAIARLERGDDLKLSTLFDYLAALDLTPAGQILTGSYTEAVNQVTTGSGAKTGEASPVQEQIATSVLAAD